MNRTPSALAAGLALGLILTACGGSSTGSAAPATRAAAPAGSAPAGSAPASTDVRADASGACGLVTADEVGAAIGKPAKLTGGAGAICTFGEIADPSVFVYVQTYADEAAMAVPKQLDGTGAEHIDGMGDDAFWVPVAGTLFVQTGSRGFSFSLPSLANLTDNPAAIKANMVALGQDALGRF